MSILNLRIMSVALVCLYPNIGYAHPTSRAKVEAKTALKLGPVSRLVTAMSVQQGIGIGKIKSQISLEPELRALAKQARLPIGKIADPALLLRQLFVAQLIPPDEMPRQSRRVISEFPRLAQRLKTYLTKGQKRRINYAIARDFAAFNHLIHGTAGVPIVGVGVIVTRQSKVPLGYRLADRCWSFPGGKLRASENIRTGSRRELLEETGLKAVGDFEIISVKHDILRAGCHTITFGIWFQKAAGRLSLREPNKFNRWKWFPISHLPANLFLPTRGVLTAFRLP